MFGDVLRQFPEVPVEANVSDEVRNDVRSRSTLSNLEQKTSCRKKLQSIFKQKKPVTERLLL